MDEFDGPRRRQGGFPPVLIALFFGALFGGGLGMQGQSLRAMSADLRQVLDSPALGGAGQAVPAAEWTPREDAAQAQADLERSLTEAWPADRLATAKLTAAPIHYALAARGAVLGAR